MCCLRARVHSAVQRGADGGGIVPIGEWRDDLDRVRKLQGLRASAIVPSSQTPGLVFVGTYEITLSGLFSAGRGGVYRSTNNGNAWDRLSGRGGLPQFHVTDLVQEPGNAGRFYVALAGETDDLNPANIGFIAPTAARLGLSLDQNGYRDRARITITTAWLAKRNSTKMS